MVIEINEHDKRAFPQFFHLKVRKGFYCHAFFCAFIQFDYVIEFSGLRQIQHNADYVVTENLEDCL